ncbi:MAG: hypothetical protein CFE46_00440 [Burkholderiales bacterium PBB6]|nr:MAG: hypothetical protein CFE46_00440 [Burkholderiales bacterium PBB6]
MQVALQVSTAAPSPSAALLARRALVASFSRAELRSDMAAGDARGLMRLVGQLRVAGCQVQPQQLRERLLAHDSAELLDNFNQPVLVRLQPAATERSSAAASSRPSAATAAAANHSTQARREGVARAHHPLELTCAC